MGKQNYLDGNWKYPVPCKSGKKLIGSGFGSDAHKEVMSIINIYSPTDIADSWIDYFMTKSHVKVLNSETVNKLVQEKSPSKGNGSSCLIKISYTGHVDNFSFFMEELKDIASGMESDLSIKDYGLAVNTNSKAKVENGKLKIKLSNPFG